MPRSPDRECSRRDLARLQVNNVRSTLGAEKEPEASDSGMDIRLFLPRRRLVEACSAALRFRLNVAPPRAFHSTSRSEPSRTA